MHCIPKIPAYRIYIDAYPPTLINCMTLNGAENKLLPKMVYHSPLSNKPTHHSLILMIWHPFVDILIFRTYQVNWVPKRFPENIHHQHWVYTQISKFSSTFPTKCRTFPNSSTHFPPMIFNSKVFQEFPMIFLTFPTFFYGFSMFSHSFAHGFAPADGALRYPSSSPSAATALACTAQPRPYASADEDRNSAEAWANSTEATGKMWENSMEIWNSMEIQQKYKGQRMEIWNGHFTGTDIHWRYRLHIFLAYFSSLCKGISQQNMALYDTVPPF